MKKILVLLCLVLFCSIFSPANAANNKSESVTLPQRSTFSSDVQNMMNEKNKNQSLENINSKNPKNYEEEDLSNTLKMLNGFTNIFNPFMMQQLKPQY